MSNEEENRVKETEEQEEQTRCGCGGHPHWGMHRHHMMRFATMSLEEEIELLEQAKEKLEERLAAINTRLQKLKA
jgi:hypothetical protein